MKKLSIVLLLLVFSIAPVYADPFLLDLDHDGDLTNAIEVNLLQADSVANFFVVIDLGADETLGAGDTFTDSYFLNILYSEDQGGSANYYFDANNLEFTASIDDIKGEITNFDDGGTSTTATDVNLDDDTWDLDFYAGDEVAGEGVATLTYDGVDIGTFLVTEGGTDSPFTADTNGTVTGSTGVTLVALSLAADYWYTMGEVDMSTVDPQSLVIGLVDSGANLEEATGQINDPNDLTDDTLTLELSDNGDTIRISVVPEPTTFVLFGLGLLGVAAISRRKNA